MPKHNKRIAQIPIATAESHPWKRRWLGTTPYWLTQFVVWGFIASLQSVALIAEERYELISAIISIQVSFLLVTHLLRVYIIHLRKQSHSWPQLLFKLGLAITCAAIPFNFATALVSHLYFDQLLPDERYNYESILSSYLILTPWVGAYFGINYYRSYQQNLLAKLKLESLVKGSELEVLRAQVDPHFLFNSLNTLRALIPPELNQPREAVTRLSEVLRANLLSREKYAVSLEEELEHIDNYLSLEKLRFEERLKIERNISPDTLQAYVPTLLLQTLVENAIKYGIAEREEGGTISITARKMEKHLELRITNPGSLNTPGTSTGLGLKNAEARLELVFDTSASIELIQPQPDLVCASVHIPLTPPKRIIRNS